MKHPALILKLFCFSFFIYVSHLLLQYGLALLLGNYHTREILAQVVHCPRPDHFTLHDSAKYVFIWVEGGVSMPLETVCQMWRSHFQLSSQSKHQRAEACFPISSRRLLFTVDADDNMLNKDNDLLLVCVWAGLQITSLCLNKAPPTLSSRRQVSERQNLFCVCAGRREHHK